MNWHLKSALNRLFFTLRTRIPVSRGDYREPAESKKGLFSNRESPALLETLKTLEERLIPQYTLNDFRENSSRVRYLETLTYLHFLERLFEGTDLPKHRPLRWLDVGAKNWSYVQALSAFIEQTTSDYELTGIELDPYRLYQDFHTRQDYAEAFIADIPQARYQPGNVLVHRGTYDVISSFLPFVFEDPCLAWGLPLDFFRPQAYLSHLGDLLAPGGVLVILNQGEAEAKKQRELLAGEDSLHVEWSGQMPPSFLEYRYPRYGWRCRKES